MNRIEIIVQSFAQPCEVQKSLFPDFANVADELAIEWEAVLEEIDDILLTDKQKQAFNVLDEYMLSISGPSNIRYWNNEALCNSKEWAVMRSMAKDILYVMEWKENIPTKNQAIYVKGGSK
ncbi:TPA: hypothetical protein JD264_21930 [Serratia fonticola]|nr:hypothetical protein [Serratia fonticola]